MKKKQVLALCLALAMAMGSLTACGSNDAPAADNAVDTPAETQAQDGAEPSADNAAGDADSTDAAVDAENAVDPANWGEYDELINEIRTTTDFVEREALMHKAEDMIMETGAILPIYYYNVMYLQKPYVSGTYANAYGFKYWMFAETEGDTLRLNQSSEPDKLDPALNTTVDGACLAVNSFSGLFTYDEDANVVPDLAADYTVSDDGLTYTFNLLPDLKWSDGSELNANDFVYAWNRAVAEETAADYFYMFDAIKHNDDGTLAVTASEDAQSITVELVAPCPYFLDLCAFPAYYPVKQSEVEAATDWQTNPGAWCQEAGFVSNGAYTLESWTHDESMTYVKNPNYHRADEVKIEKLQFMLSADDTAVFAAYNAGDLDFVADTIPTDEIQTLLGNPEFHTIDQIGTYYVGFNVKSDLFADKTPAQANAMRRAFALLVDRDYIAENIGQTGQKPANTFVPTGMADGNGGIFKENDDAYTYPNEATAGYYDPEALDENVEEAIELLKFAGYEFTDDGVLSDSTPISFEYLTNDTTTHVAIAEALQQDFGFIGINMTIKTVDWNVFLNERKAGNYDIARNGWLADFNDPINMLEMWTTASGNNDCQFGR